MFDNRPLEDKTYRFVRYPDNEMMVLPYVNNPGDDPSDFHNWKEYRSLHDLVDDAYVNPVTNANREQNR